MSSENTNDEDSNKKMDAVGLFLRAMVDREPGKRKVKASKAALIDLAQIEMGDSSDDSDFNVDEAKLNDDDDVSINSDPECDEELDEEEEEDSSDEEEERIRNKNTKHGSASSHPSVNELLQKAEQKQQIENVPKVLVCAVCLGDNSDDTNEIVTCDGWCHISVHEGCYGVSDTVSVSSTVSSSSTEPWFCDACKAGVRNPSCELCPNLGYSIFKETEMGRWVHLVCALYVPGVAFSEVDKLSFPTLFEMAYSRYGGKVCSLCDDARYSKTGVCISCDAGMCRAHFHVTCAQKQGLLSEVNHGEADQADPYYAHCKLHTDKELIKKRKRNWLALQLHTKQTEQLALGTKEQSRLERKHDKYREKYEQTKLGRPRPWYPTQKMPRAISTCASVFRTLLHKTKLMDIETETPEAELIAIGDIRKKWHIAPAFNLEYISYYIDRTHRLKDMNKKLESLLEDNSKLIEEDTELVARLDELEKSKQDLLAKKNSLLSKSLELHNILKGLAGRPLPLPPVVAALHNPPAIPSFVSSPVSNSSGERETRRVITKAAAKMIQDPFPTDISLGQFRQNSSDLIRTTSSCGAFQPSSASSKHFSQAVGKGKPAYVPAASSSCKRSVGTKAAASSQCSVCKEVTEQHLQVQCDACVLYYHLHCLDPPLARMPKKTKQIGWQCSDCCKLSDTEKYVPEIPSCGPRRLRRKSKDVAQNITEVDSTGDVKLNSQSCGTAAADGADYSKKASNKVVKRRRSSADPSKKVHVPAAKKVKTDDPDFEAESKLKMECVSSSNVGYEEGKNLAELCKNIKEGDCKDNMIIANLSGNDFKPKSNLLSPNRDETKEINTNYPDQDSIQTTTNNWPTTLSIPPAFLPVATSNNPSASLDSSVHQSIGLLNPLSQVVPHPLDISADSLPSAGSLHSPTSESINSHEEDNTLSRKDKKHRSSSKKKKKDRNGEKGEKKHRKHHHHHHHHHRDVQSQSSEMLAPLRLKIKPLPPRPSEAECSSPAPPVDLHLTLLPHEGGTPTVETQPAPPPPTTATPPPGYPPLPPGYTLTQPLLADPKEVLLQATSELTGGNKQSEASVQACSGGQQQFSICDVCKETGGVTSTVQCDDCHKAYHFNCLDPPLKKTPKRRGYSWFCEDCEPK